MLQYVVLLKEICSVIMRIVSPIIVTNSPLYLEWIEGCTVSEIQPFFIHSLPFSFIFTVSNLRH
jgi:hypothetical protein